jgi:hypothetical protein
MGSAKVTGACAAHGRLPRSGFEHAAPLVRAANRYIGGVFLLAFCGCAADRPSTGQGTSVGVIQQDLQAQVVASDPAHVFAETAAIAVNSTNNVWETVTNYTNGLSGRFDIGNFNYACTRNNYGSWNEYNISGFQSGPDPSVIYRSNCPNVRVAYASLYAGTAAWSGITLLLTGEPCRASGNPSWYASYFPTISDGSADHPWAVYKASTDVIYAVFTQKGDAAQFTLNVINFNTAQRFFSNCSNMPSGPGVPVAAIDSSGDIHIAYWASNNGMYHEVFHTSTNSFHCLNNYIGPIGWQPAGRCTYDCGGAGLGPLCPTYSTYNNLLDNAGAAQNCIVMNPVPTIAIDKTAIPNDLVVAYNTPGSGSCASYSEMRVYRNAGLGNGAWDYRMVTGCQNSIFPQAMPWWVDGYSSTADLFYILSSYSVGGYLYGTEWTSSNGGLNWSGTYYPSAYRPTPTPAQQCAEMSRCFIGHYDAAAADIPHNKRFYDWGAQGAGVPRVRIEGMTLP